MTIIEESKFFFIQVPSLGSAEYTTQLMWSLTRKVHIFLLASFLHAIGLVMNHTPPPLSLLLNGCAHVHLLTFSNGGVISPQTNEIAQRIAIPNGIDENRMGNAFAHVHTCKIDMEGAAYTWLTEWTVYFSVCYQAYLLKKACGAMVVRMCMLTQ